MRSLNRCESRFGYRFRCDVPAEGSGSSTHPTLTLRFIVVYPRGPGGVDNRYPGLIYRIFCLATVLGPNRYTTAFIRSDEFGVYRAELSDSYTV